ncbi:MAG: DUF899 domain-containing protein [Acidobacteria bacterium]|nr:MAG: DUF899 domain-containing protein [Acidobacteriota bacterium]REK01086.1 MAG: DUF899 domain-containing protein [Acidobacteriota bacterium]
MNDQRVVSRDEWLAERRELLAEEKELDRRRDALSSRRCALPWVRVERAYRFEAEGGELSLRDLFGDREQLVVQHFMFGPDWQEGCKHCSFWADGFDPMVVHLHHRGVAFAAVSRAPLASLLAYRDRMGWSFPWVSSLGTTFNYDYGVSVSDDDMEAGATSYNYREIDPGELRERPGMSVFVRRGDDVFHTYSTYARGLDRLNAAYQVLDMVPRGRDENDLPYPMAWVRRRDEYE